MLKICYVVVVRTRKQKIKQTFQLSVLKMSEIGHNRPPMAGSHLGGSGGMAPRKNFENLSP